MKHRKRGRSLGFLSVLDSQHEQFPFFLCCLFVHWNLNVGCGLWNCLSFKSGLKRPLHTNGCHCLEQMVSFKNQNPSTGKTKKKKKCQQKNSISVSENCGSSSLAHAYVATWGSKRQQTMQWYLGEKVDSV